MKAVLSLVLIFALFVKTYGQSNQETKFITVAGKKIAYKACGLSTRKLGGPLIIFEAGAGSGKESFEHFLSPVLAKDMAWIMYDRPGLSGSEADEGLKTDTDVVNRLHDFLKALNLAPPYLLVGHSMGGALIRLFAGLYPNEVAGLVLIDPTNFMLTRAEDEQIKMNSGSQTGYIDLYVGMLKKMSMDTILPQGMRSEMKRISELHASGYFKEYSSLAPLPNIPTTVMIAYNSPIEQGEKELFKEYTINGVAWFEQVNKYRIQHYAHIIKNHTNSLIMLLLGYQHVIHHRDPQLAAATIADVYRKCITKP